VLSIVEEYMSKVNDCSEIKLLLTREEQGELSQFT
jgi:hypothetical protein